MFNIHYWVTDCTALTGWHHLNKLYNPVFRPEKAFIWETASAVADKTICDTEKITEKKALIKPNENFP